MQQNRKEILAAGFDGYQPKPINVAAFLEAVRETLDGRQRDRPPALIAYVMSNCTPRSSSSTTRRATSSCSRTCSR